LERVGKNSIHPRSDSGGDVMRSVASSPRGRMKKIRRAWLSIAILALAMGCPFAYAQQPANANFVFVDGAAVTLSPDSAGAFELDTPVKNSGGPAGEPSFKLRGLEKAKCNQDPLAPDPAIGSLDANAIAIAHIKITNVPLPAVCYIEIETNVNGKVVNTSLKQVKLSQRYATSDVLAALLVCLLLSAATMILVRIVVWLMVGKLSGEFEVGMPAWDFAKSWSANLTLAGAIVTGALALGALPESTRHASKAGYGILALFIAMVVVVAPLVFVVFRWGSVEKDEQTKKPGVVYGGGLFAFLSSCALTLFAGLAQLVILFLLGDEMFRDYGVWSFAFRDCAPWSIGLGSMSTAAAAIVLCDYTVRSMLLTIQLQLYDATAPKIQKAIEEIKVKAGAAREAETASELATEFEANGYFLRGDKRAALSKIIKGLKDAGGQTHPPRSWPML
jgi:hypothetical protein